jgi:diaminopimelate decarboxylase
VEGILLNSHAGFHYIDGQLHCDGVPAAELAERFGTPCYVYSGSLLKERYARIRDAFAAWEPQVCFSVKSLGNLAVLRLLAEQGSGFDVVSGGELYRVLQAGGEAADTVYAGVGKTASEIEYALESGVGIFNVESTGEMHGIAAAARKARRIAQVAVRVNPDIDPGTHEKTTTGKKENKFGVGVPEALKLARATASMDDVRLRGLHVHLGSPIYSPGPYVEALQKLSDLYGELRSAGLELDLVNLGGGYPMSYTGEAVPAPEEYAEAMAPLVDALECRLIIEPGRYISAPSGVFLTRVLYRKGREGGKRFLICDGGMNDLLRPTLYDAFHRVWPVAHPEGMPQVMRPEQDHLEGFATEPVDVVGPVCESGDFLARHRAMPPVQVGQVLAVFDAGAYGFTMSSNYNARPRPPEVLLREGNPLLARWRETYEDLLTGESTTS